MKDVDARVLAAFRVEYPEHLDALRSTLTELARAGAPDLQAALRHAHNLKGAARAVDMYAVEGLAHRLETVFARAGRGELRIEAAAARVLEVALDAIDAAVAGEPGSEAAQLALDQLLGTVEAAPPAERPAPRLSTIQEAVDSMRVSVSAMDRLLASTAMLAQEGQRQEGLSRDLAELRSAVDRLQSAHAARDRETVDPLLKAMAHRLREVQRRQLDGSWSLSHSGSRLSADARRLMLVPARTVFEGFPRLMRELARDLGKTYEFSLEGGDVEADRRVLQGIKDGVLHLLRNAAYHGIERPEARRAAGKPERGRIALDVQARGATLVVRVEDDGAGVDVARAAAVGEKRGLVGSASPTLADVVPLLFQPGFSTAREVSEVAGRGIGLSVVQMAADRLQGDVLVDSRPGRGTVFTLSVPLAVSLQTVFLVTSQDQTFAVSIGGIDRLYRVPLAQVDTVLGQATLSTPAGPLPIWSLGHLLFGEGQPVASGGYLEVLVVKAGRRRLAVAVDALVGRHQGVTRALGPVLPAGMRCQSGMVLGDGSVALLVTPADLLEAAREAGPAAPLAAVPEPAPVPEPQASRRVLVVDDSFTTRTLEKGILESHGYEVRVAVDGLEALAVLRTTDVDLVIVDVQMPRLDGFGLLASLKADPRLARLPVIMVTSLESPEDQARGLELGADAYIVKRTFEQRALLETVQQLL
ncbi:MAG TPA: response regulator [Candidatus Xenobia bacterium]